MGLGELLGSFKDELVKKAKRIEHEKEKAATMSDNEICYGWWKISINVRI